MRRIYVIFTAVSLIAISLALPGAAQANRPSVRMESEPGNSGPGLASAATLTLQVDASQQHAISPYIYGLNFADAGLAAELKLPVNRWGGNGTTRYNWKLDAANHASDWYFENIPNDNDNLAALPNGSSSDQFVEQNIASGTQTLLTLPLIGWTPKDRVKGCGFSRAKYGDQADADWSWMPDCGNGVKPDGTNVTGNDPTDTSLAIGPSFVQDWIRHLDGRYGAAGAGGVQFYDLDNEPMLWNSTHRDVHPTPTSYDELRDRTYQYAAAVKAVDPAAQTLGPVLWGWTAYFYSALDEASGGSWWNNPLDYNAHGKTPFVAWYLAQMKTYEQAHGTRILDYLDLHFYPQNGVALTGAGDARMQALRLRSTRALWDPSYQDESWIGDSVQLIPRMHAWVTANYPGTKTAISEYNWGGLESLNGALTEADILGIFGREGLDLATLWSPPASGDPGAYAFRMYRNYDGAGGQFGSLGVSAASSSQDTLSVYASLRPADGALTVIAINKTGSAQNAALALAHFTPSGPAKVYRYSGANLTKITAQADQAVSTSGFSASYPANSITLFVIPSGKAIPIPTPSPMPTPRSTVIVVYSRHIFLPLTRH
jgi:hypothetical protein